MPTPNVSIVCLTAQVQRATNAADVNGALRDAAVGPLRGILAVEDRPLVSVDFIGNPHSSIVDSAQTQVLDGDLIEVQSWYDNEFGFASRMVDLTRIVASKG